MAAPDKEFVYQLTEWQNRLFGYLVTLLGKLHDARDVLQETNLVLWRKMEEFEPGTNFGAWARKCAYCQALAFLRDRKRDRSHPCRVWKGARESRGGFYIDDIVVTGN